MNKKFIAIATLTFGVTLGTLITTPVIAEDATDYGVMEINNTAETTESTTTDSTDDTTTVTTDETTTSPTLQEIEDAGTSGEAEVVCVEESDENCTTAGETEIVEEEPAADSDLEESETTEEEGEPEVWPMILSFAALGVMVIVIIVLGVMGRKK